VRGLDLRRGTLSATLTSRLHQRREYPPFGRNCMDRQQRHSRMCSENQPRPFSTTVSAHPGGGWATVVNLGDGATLTKVFDNEREALRYGDELADWLAQRPTN